MTNFCHNWMPHSLHNWMPYSLYNWMPYSLHNWMPYSLDNWMPCSLDNWMPCSLDNWMPCSVGIRIPYSYHIRIPCSYHIRAGIVMPLLYKESVLCFYCHYCHLWGYYSYYNKVKWWQKRWQKGDIGGSRMCYLPQNGYFLQNNKPFLLNIAIYGVAYVYALIFGFFISVNNQ